MDNIVGIVSFYLKPEVSTESFLLAHKNYNQDFVSKQEGYISHKLFKKMINGLI